MDDFVHTERGRQVDYTTTSIRHDGVERLSAVTKYNGYHVNLHASYHKGYSHWEVQAMLWLEPGVDPVHSDERHDASLEDATWRAIDNLRVQLRLRLGTIERDLHDLRHKQALIKSALGES